MTSKQYREAQKRKREMISIQEVKEIDSVTDRGIVADFILWGYEVVTSDSQGNPLTFRMKTETTKTRRIHSPRKAREATPEELEESYPI